MNNQSSNCMQLETALAGMTTAEFLSLLEKASPEQLDSIAKIGQSQPSSLPTAPFRALLKSEQHTGLASIVKWWEGRRAFYNLVVGLCGLPAVFLVSAYGHASALAILAGILCYGISANVAYTLGAPLDLLAWMKWKNRASHVGPLLLVAGTVFSTMLTLGSGLVILMALFVSI